MTVLTFICWLSIAYYSKLYALFLSWLYFLWENSLIGLFVYIIYLFRKIKKEQRDIERFVIRSDPDNNISMKIIKYLRFYCSIVDFIHDKLNNVFSIMIQYFPINIIYRCIILIDKILNMLIDTMIHILIEYVKKIGSEVISIIKQNMMNVSSNDNVSNTPIEMTDDKMKMLNSLSAMTETLTQTMGGIMKMEEQHNKMKQRGNRHSGLLNKLKASME